MRTTTVMLFFALAAAGILTAVSLGPAPEGFWAPEGFVAQADTVIRRGHLELRCADQDSIVVSLPEGGPAEDFFNASYLRSDVRTFNSSPDATRSPFLVEGCRIVGVDPFYHRIDLPYNRLPRWRGDILFTFDGLTATFEGGADQELEIRHPVDRTDAARSSARVSPDREGASVYTSLLRLTEPGAGPEVLVEAFFVGDDPVLADRRDVGSDEVIRVNGFQTPPGRMLRVESGDWLQVVGADAGGSPAERPWTYLAETGERARTASFVRMRNDRVDRLFPARRLRPFLEAFSQAMDLALHTLPGAGEGRVAEADVRLTMDRELSDALDTRISAWCTERAHPTRPRATSLLVMDAFTGAVRAMPSCPGGPELTPFEPLSSRTRERFLRNQNLVPHPVGSAAKPFWAAAVATTYPNFLDLEIPTHAAGPADTAMGCPLRAPYNDGHGSAGWTGLEEFLQLSCNRYVVELASAALGLGSEASGSVCRKATTPSAFARCLPLALRPSVGSGTTGGDTAIGTDDAGTGRVRFCDAVVNTVLAPGMEVVGGRCDDLQLVDANFTPGPVMGSLANVSVYREPSPGAASGDGIGRGGTPALGEHYRFGRYRIDAWREVLQELEAAGDTAHLVQTALRFSAVSSQATNLALNTVEELRTDWVNLLLGGENARWSNFQLAEATARLVTGRTVRGMFVDSLGFPGRTGDAIAPRDSVELLADATLHPGVRRRVLHGMELVLAAGGTAGRLDPAIARLQARVRDLDPEAPWELRAFAKTGTPAVEKFVSSAQQRLVERLFSEGDLAWRDGTFALAPGREERIRAEMGSGALRWLVEDVLQPMAADPEGYREARDGRLPAHPLYFARDGGLRVRRRADLRVDRQGGVLVLSLLAVPPDQGRGAAADREGDFISACVLDPGLRRRILEVPPAELLDPERAVALSVAIYLDDLSPGQGSAAAVELAGRVMDDIGNYLEREIRRKLERAGS